MARFRARFRKKPNLSWAITGAVTLGLLLLVGNNILESVGTTIGNITCTAVQLNDTCGVGAGVDYNAPFYTAFNFIGLADTGGTFATTGILGILGLVTVASFVLAFIKVSFRN